MVTPMFQDEVGYYFRALSLLLALAEFVTETITSCLQNSGLPIEIYTTAEIITVPMLKSVYTLLFQSIDKLVSSCLGARFNRTTTEILLISSYL
jgi:hypothetical protein